jgi:ABC-type polar amino acid transport system ATPase subunit
LSARIQQRVALVRALIMPKRVLFLDNVLASLTPTAARWWIDHVQQARAQAAAAGRPLAVVVSTHDMRGWLDVATKFAMIRDHRFQVLNGRDEAHREGAPVWNQLETGAN